MGLDHNLLTYYYGGLDQKLTGVQPSQVIQEVIAPVIAARHRLSHRLCCPAGLVEIPGPGLAAHSRAAAAAARRPWAGID